MEKDICKNCIYAQEEFVMGNGITESEFLNFVICPFENQQYKHPYDKCNHINEAIELITILRNQ